MTQSTEQPKVQEETTVPSGPALAVDWSRYAAMLEDSELSEDQKREFLETLWSIIVAFVDLGFGIHPLQQACERNLDFGETTPAVGADVVDYGCLLNNTEEQPRAPSFTGRATEVTTRDA